ncbi:MAG: right-handed parallel beta-helix repeat-containing protein [Sandaracinaceae bacterium]|nr:MAG: right-handed parallel beta-helix repeat-containing protein [Sandaracinaceae bacterium]
MTRWLPGSLALLVLLAACDGEVVPAADADTSPLPDGAPAPGPDGAPAPMDAGTDGEVPPGAVGVTARLPDGRLGEPTTTFTLPAVDEGMGMYIPDLQDRFPEVDWETLDRLYIPAGHYPFIRLGNLPARDRDARPLVVTNLGGQVRVGGLGHHYLFVIEGGSGFVLSGRYDPVSRTGDAAFPGHRDNAYANTAGRYGFLIDDAHAESGRSGLGVGGGASDFELEFIEIRGVGFAGMLIKTDDDASATMRDVWIHDNYIHDTVSEGMYLGSTQSQPQHTLEGFDVSYNRVLRAGTESIQLGQLAGDNEVHHNVFGPSAIDWRDAFQRFQDGNLQVSIRSGVTRVHHNVFLGAAGSMVGLFGNDVPGDAHAAGDGVIVEDNYLGHFRSLAVYGIARDVEPLTFTIANNEIRGHHFDRDEVYTDATPPGHMIRQGNGATDFEVRGNRFDDGDRLCSPVPAECNGEATGFIGADNEMVSLPPIAFRDAGLPDDFDYLSLELWTDVASLGGDAPVTYPSGDVVMYEGAPYRCVADPCPAGAVPDVSPESWEPMEAFADDVRATGAHASLGLGDG